MAIRVCSKCELRPASNLSGVARCTECHYRQSQKHRLCDCGVQFKTSNNSTRCSSCSYQRRKVLIDRECPKCKALIDPRSRNCAQCRTTDRRVLPIGTRRTRKDGYASIKTEKGWIREHTLVMEEFLNRRLFRGETVHHRNGVRNDNRLKNLELWSTSQPAGQRIEDLLIWADEIIGMYRNQFVAFPS